MNLQKELIKYFESLGIKVNLNTKARGHQGFFLNNRIDVSVYTPMHRIIPTLLHEFAHYIFEKTGSSGLEEYEQELLKVTYFVDKNSSCERFLVHKNRVKAKIKEQENIIKLYYPNFQRSKKFKEFDKYIKKSKAKYLLKYDKIKLVSRWLKRVEIFSVDDIEKDFPDMPTAFAAYIRLKSAQKKQSRISARINKLKKYYSKPTELFARLIEGLYIDENKTRAAAPFAVKRFYELLEEGYYQELKHVFEILRNDCPRGNFDNVLTLC